MNKMMKLFMIGLKYTKDFSKDGYDDDDKPLYNLYSIK